MRAAKADLPAQRDQRVESRAARSLQRQHRDAAVLQRRHQLAARRTGHRRLEVTTRQPARQLKHAPRDKFVAEVDHIEHAYFLLCLGHVST